MRKTLSLLAKNTDSQLFYQSVSASNSHKFVI